MPNAFITKWRRRVFLADEDVATLEAACAGARHYPAKRDLIREGDPPGPVLVFLEGWGYRYKLLPEGGRQVLSFMMPGDFCDMHTTVLDEMDHTIATATKATVATIPRARMTELIDMKPGITRAHQFPPSRSRWTTSTPCSAAPRQQDTPSNMDQSRSLGASAGSTSAIPSATSSTC